MMVAGAEARAAGAPTGKARFGVIPRPGGAHEVIPICPEKRLGAHHSCASSGARGHISNLSGGCACPTRLRTGYHHLSLRDSLRQVSGQNYSRVGINMGE